MMPPEPALPMIPPVLPMSPPEPPLVVPPDPPLEGAPPVDGAPPVPDGLFSTISGTQSNTMVALARGHDAPASATSSDARVARRSRHSIEPTSATTEISVTVTVQLLAIGGMAVPS
jgi:hypothetical protein